MEDAVRPSKEAFKAMYERGYRTWASLWEMAAADPPGTQHHGTDLCSVFPSHPYFPGDLEVDKSFSDTVTVRGRTTWTTTQGPCDLPSFQKETVFHVASSNPKTIELGSRLRRIRGLPNSMESNHVPILLLAWAYILSARWAELIPGAHGPAYTSSYAGLHIRTSSGLNEPREDDGLIVVDVGDVDVDAARWWAAVLAVGSGWNAGIRNNKGQLLSSPWSIRTNPESTFIVDANVELPSPEGPRHDPASFSTAMLYLSEYCALHGIADQSNAALSAALLIPLSKASYNKIRLPLPRLPPKPARRQDSQRTQAPSVWTGELQQLDRLLTLSCNCLDVQTLLISTFFEPDVPCNLCGAWLQGSFAFLDSDKAKNSQILLRTFVRRDPDLGFLWLGAFITGARSQCLQHARSGGWVGRLISAAAWTGTHASFIQDAVRRSPDVGDMEISRADECRLMYLINEHHPTPPLFPFPPFGSTLMQDTDLEVRRHARCSATHVLGYGGFTWDCQDGKKVEQQGRSGSPDTAPRPKAGQPDTSGNNIAVDYGALNLVDYVSESVTHNAFMWLRGNDGFPVAERAIREHEWIENLDSEDDDPLEVNGDSQSTAGRNLGGWLLRQATERSNSL